MNTHIPWPDGKRFAFTVFDDPDGCSKASRQVYHLMRDLGLRTTMGVWPLAPRREANSAGETCGDSDYRKYALDLQESGFELGYHNAAPHPCTREEIVESFDRYYDYFGHYPTSGANHYSTDAIYHGLDRLLPGYRRTIYDLAFLGRQRNRFQGHIEGSPYFWGDLCRQHIRYFRNWVFRDIDTWQQCPMQPYSVPQRPYINAFFCSSEGTDCEAFLKTIADAHIDKLAEQGGMCIMYTHFGKGFVNQGKLEPAFVRSMSRISRLDGWFPTVTELLDYLASVRGVTRISPRDLARLESKWLFSKLLHGTS